LEIWSKYAFEFICKCFLYAYLNVFAFDKYVRICKVSLLNLYVHVLYAYVCECAFHNNMSTCICMCFCFVYYYV
jgi:hypothetical protein